MKHILILLLFIHTLLYASNSQPTQQTTGKDSKYTLLAWNDLGMHCFDGIDYSIFSILPPYNNLHAHLIVKNGTEKKHIKKDVILTYEALAYKGRINTRSADKTNFWDHQQKLFPGSTSVKEVGLTGNKTPSTKPHPMVFNELHNRWEAEGIPIVNRDDSNLINNYPMVRVVAKNTAGEILATADVVLPVSDEMDCVKCHSSNSTNLEAKPKAGWENHTDKLKDAKLNILKLHDQKRVIGEKDLAALKSKGYDYKESLYETAISGTPILCASCHSSNALGTESIGNAASLTSAIHSLHAKVFDKETTLTGRSTCYTCHPGENADCLRGSMGKAKDKEGKHIMECQNCHGSMHDVGDPKRRGWLDEPSCQACHQNRERHTSALVNGTLREALDRQFATTPDAPAKGLSLYRYSTGHGDLHCSSCHGSTHATFPSKLPQDNIYSQQIQGHSGTVAECSSCHTKMPKTVDKGPHGIHSLGQEWVDNHEIPSAPYYEQCEKCHGYEYEGSFLSKAFSKRSFKVDNKIVTYEKGQVVGCYDCHGKKWKYKD